MPEWIIKRTDSFLKQLKEHKNHRELLRELDKKIQRLKGNPESVGGKLSGPLHGRSSTRLVGKYRLIFQVDPSNHEVYLVALDHRSRVYS